MLSWYWLILLWIARAILLVVLAYAVYKTMPLYETIARLPGGLSEQIAIKGRSSW